MNIQGVPTFNYRLKTLPVTSVRDCRDIPINNSIRTTAVPKRLLQTPHILGVHRHQSIRNLFQFFLNLL